MLRRALMPLLLMSITLPLYSQSSNEPEPEYPICLSASEWNALEEQVWAETQRAVNEAVEEVANNHKVYEAQLRAEIDSLNCQLKGWRIAAFASLGVGVALAVALAILF